MIVNGENIPIPIGMAREYGLSFYEGKICQKHSNPFRYLSSRGCTKCRYEKHRDPVYRAKCNAKMRKWRANNPEKSKASSRALKEANPLRQMYYSAKWRAKQRNIPFGLAFEDVERAFPANGRCPVLGIKITAVGYRKKAQKDSASLDRIRPELGYVVGNIQIISWRANALKSNATLEELRSMVRHLETLQ